MIKKMFVEKGKNLKLIISDMVGDSIYCTPDQGIVDIEPVLGSSKNIEDAFTKVTDRPSKIAKKAKKEKDKNGEDVCQLSWKETGTMGKVRDSGEISITGMEQAMQDEPCIEKNSKSDKGTRRKQKASKKKVSDGKDKVGGNQKLTAKSDRNRRKGAETVDASEDTEGIDAGTKVEVEKETTKQNLETKKVDSASFESKSEPGSKQDCPNITCKSRKSSRQRKSTGSIRKQVFTDSHKTAQNKAVKRFSLQSSAADGCEIDSGNTEKDQLHKEKLINTEEIKVTAAVGKKKKMTRSKAMSEEFGTSKTSQKRKPADMNTSILPDVTGCDTYRMGKKKRWTLNGQVDGDKSGQEKLSVVKRKEKGNFHVNINPLLHRFILTHQQQTAFENVVGKAEIACNEQFLLFPQFSTLSDNYIPICPYF